MAASTGSFELNSISGFTVGIPRRSLAFSGFLLVGLSWVTIAGGRPEFSPLPTSPYESSGLWQPFVTLRAGAGYRSNPLLASDAAGTGFGLAGADLFLLRLPTGTTTFTGLFSADDVRYFKTLRPVTNEPGATQEQTFLTDALIGHGLGSSTNWMLKLEGRHLYNDQFLNTSSFDALTTNLSSLRAVTHSGSIIPAVAWASGNHWQIEFAAVGTRQVFLNADPDTGLSSIWEVGPRMTVSYRTSRLGSLDLELSGVHREFDDRVQSSPLGLPLAGTRLRQDDLRADATWRRNWGHTNHWQTSLRAYYVRRRENGDGYTDYDRVGVVGSVRYEATHWLTRITARWSTFDYPRSYIVFGGVLAVPRERDTGQVEARLEYKFSHTLRLYGEYQWEREQANRLSDNYTAHVATVGLEHDF